MEERAVPLDAAEGIARQVAEACLSSRDSTGKPVVDPEEVEGSCLWRPPPGLEDVVGSPSPDAVPSTALQPARAPAAAVGGQAGPQPSAGGADSLSCAVPKLVRLAEHGDEAAVLSRLEQGEDPNQADDFGLTALHGAAKKGHKGVVAQLLRWKADVNRSSGWMNETPFHYACKYGHTEVVRLLLESGADPTAQSSDGRTPQQYALQKGHSGVFELVVGFSIRASQEQS